MDAPEKPQQPQHEAESEHDRRVANIFLLVFFVVVVGVGIWLANAMIEHRRIDDCMAQGRRNCQPIDVR
jgi:cytoskeletal protein RodZ